MGAYAKAIWPDPAACCGVRLRPFCLGHALLLQRLGSPFARDDSTSAGLGDLVTAVYVCSRNWRAAARGIRGRWFGFWARWRAFRRWKHEDADAAAWNAYLRAGWFSPKTWKGQDRSGIRGTDAVQILVATQRLRWGKSIRAALDTPVAEAIMDHLDQLEAGGALRVWGARDDALSAKLEEILGRSRDNRPEGPIAESRAPVKAEVPCA